MRWQGAVLASVVALVALFLSGCGGNNNGNTPVNPYAPIPGQPNPYYPGGGGYGYCQPIYGDYPLNPPRNEPITASLRSATFAGSSANALSITMSYLYYDFNKQQQSLVGGGNFDFPDIQYLVPFSMSGYSTSYCVASSSLGSATPQPGVYVNGALQLTLRGYMTLPLPQQNNAGYVPFGYPNQYQQPYGYGYGPQTTQEPVEVSIGTQSCGAQISSGRIVGCVTVKVGQGYNAQTLYYQAQ